MPRPLPPAWLLVVRAAAVAFLIGTFSVSAQPRPDLLAANIDSTVSPREDFFQYANGAWLQRNPIPDDQTRWGIWNVASAEVYTQLREISEAVASRPAPRGSAEQIVGDFWATGMDAATINAQGHSALQPVLDQIDRIRTLGDLVDVVAILHRRKVLVDVRGPQPRVLFADAVEPDETSSESRIFTLSPGGISIGRMAYVPTNVRAAKAREALRDYMARTFVRLQRDPDSARARADVVFALEARLAQGFDLGAEARRLGLEELGRLAPSVDWPRYFSRLGVTGLKVIEVRQPRFFENLSSALRTAPLDDWKDYLRFWLVRLHAPFLDDATFAEFFAADGAVAGQVEPRPRWRRVVWQQKNWLGLPMSKLYAERQLPKDTRARYQALGEAIRQSFRDRIERLDWMSESTKRQAVRKLTRLSIVIGSPETSIDFSTLPVQRDSYVLNIIRAAEWFHDWQVKRLHAPIDKTANDLHPGIGGDAGYDVHENEVRVPSPVAAPGVADRELDDAIVYGATALGHEIAHAFDSEGRYYDADGNKVDWWTAADAAAFEARAQLLVDQYSEFTPLPGVRVDGRRSLGENMADVVGLRIKLDAFKKTAQFKKNERIAGFTPLQRFFLAYAYGMMGHERPESLATRASGSYAPDRERVNGAVVNMPEFYEAFGVKPGDRMYRPENARARVW